MKLFGLAFASFVLLIAAACVNDPYYTSGFTNGRPRGERIIEAAASKPTPTPANRLTQPVDATGAPLQP